MHDLINIVKKKGFRDTVNILMSENSHAMSRHDFYNKLNETSYYNSFIRIKDELIQRDLIELEEIDGTGNKTVIIRLTPKGVYLYQKLSQLDELIKL